MKINARLFFPALGVLVAIIIVLSLNLDQLQGSIDLIYSSCISNFGWLFIFVDICCLIFALWALFSKYRNVRLGGPNAKPKFSTLAWAGMMFTTSCGAWLIVYGFLEPLYCVSQEAVAANGTIANTYELGQMYAHFHWGMNAWCIYVPATIAIGYVIYNKRSKRTTLGESITMLPQKPWSRVLKYVINVIAICGAVLAPVISIGTGMPLLVQLAQTIFNIPEEGAIVVQIAILVIWVLTFGISVYLGLRKGIQRLSNLNVKLAFVFMGIFALLVGLVQVFSSEINSLGLLAENFLRLNTFTDPYGEGSFVKGWTFGYWACYFVYMPLMGVFTAKISEGRTLKEISFGLLILCSLGCWFAMATFGNFAINLDNAGVVDIAAILATGDEAGAVTAIMEQTPLPQVFMVVLFIILFIFLATTVDSSAFAAAEMTVIQEEFTEEQSAPRWMRVIWALVTAIIAFIIVQIGGAKAVRSLCYAAGLPLAIVAIFVIISAVKMIREDYIADLNASSNNDRIVIANKKEFADSNESEPSTPEEAS